MTSIAERWWKLNSDCRLTVESLSMVFYYELKGAVEKWRLKFTHQLRIFCFNIYRWRQTSVPNRISISGQERHKIHIKDSGPGIPPLEQVSIFKPFFTTRSDGTGLGLSISKSLAEANEGKLRLLTSDNSGTVIEIQLKKVKTSAIKENSNGK